MPHSCIPITHGDWRFRDEQGEEFDTLRHARDAALTTLADEAGPDGACRTFQTLVGDGKHVGVATPT